MLHITAREPLQNRIRISGSDAQRCGILDFSRVDPLLERLVARPALVECI
jgi:hypothetical protein